MDRGAALKRLSSLLMRGGHSRLNSVAAQPSTTGLQYARGIAASAAAAAKGAQATPPQQVPAQPAGGRAGGGGGGGGGGRSMGPVLLLPAGVAAGLGAWQLARRSDKVQQLDDRLAAMRVGASSARFQCWHIACQYQEHDVGAIAKVAFRAANGGSLPGCAAPAAPVDNNQQGSTHTLTSQHSTSPPGNTYSSFRNRHAC